MSENMNESLPKTHSHERYMHLRRPHPIYVARVEFAALARESGARLRKVDLQSTMAKHSMTALLRVSANEHQRRVDWSAFLASWGRF